MYDLLIITSSDNAFDTEKKPVVKVVSENASKYLIDSRKA